MGPDGRPILEPSVNLLRTSHDGAWLATVDEWIPPAADLSYIEEGIPAFNAEERSLRREVYLKIWRRDEQNTQWVLDARIDAPHFMDGLSAPARVFDLIADPSGAAFATVGEDRTVRIWKPKTRMRDGVVVRGADRMRGLVDWTLSRAIKLPNKLTVDDSADASQDTIPRTSRLAFSADGSVLAAGISWASDEDPGVIHIIDTATGTITRSLTEIDVSALSGLAILNHHLIILGSAVVSWDLVLDRLVYSIPNKMPGVRVATHSQMLRLAVNEADNTFAVSTPRLAKTNPEDTRYSKVATKLTVYEPASPEPLWHCAIPEAVVLGLVPARGGKGFVALDSSSNVRVVRPTAATMALASSAKASAKAEEASMDVDVDVDVDEDDDSEDVDEVVDAEVGFDAEAELLRNAENDKPVVRAEQLQEVFESGAGSAMAGVRELFGRVVALYGRRPRSVGVV